VKEVAVLLYIVFMSYKNWAAACTDANSLIGSCLLTMC